MLKRRVLFHLNCAENVRVLDGNNDEVTVEDEQKQKQLAMGWYRNP